MARPDGSVLAIKSLPSRERGSKPLEQLCHPIERSSLPSRERGSKPCRPTPTIGVICRSLRGSVDRNSPAVSITATEVSRSLRGSVDRNLEQHDVALGSGLSLPSRERGSKRAGACRPRQRARVAPFAGAWIETGTGSIQVPRSVSRSLRGSVDRNIQRAPGFPRRHRRSLRGSVDRNLERAGGLDVEPIRSLPSRERGSKRDAADPRGPAAHVAPFAGAWIETRSPKLRPCRTSRRSLRGSVDRNHQVSIVVE